jgi:hypothetical protein
VEVFLELFMWTETSGTFLFAAVRFPLREAVLLKVTGEHAAPVAYQIREASVASGDELSGTVYELLEV